VDDPVTKSVIENDQTNANNDSNKVKLLMSYFSIGKKIIYSFLKD
jgi:hypothetical protein